MADQETLDPSRWFLLSETEHRWKFETLVELAQRRIILVECAGHRAGQRSIRRRMRIPHTWWAGVIIYCSPCDEITFPRGAGRMPFVAEGAAFYIPPEVERALDEGREAELDQEPVSVPGEPVPPVHTAQVMPTEQPPPASEPVVTSQDLADVDALHKAGKKVRHACKEVAGKREFEWSTLERAYYRWLKDQADSVPTNATGAAPSKRP